MKIRNENSIYLIYKLSTRFRDSLITTSRSIAAWLTVASCDKRRTRSPLQGTSINFLLIFTLLFYTYTGYSADFPITMDSRIKTYIYNPNEVFPVVLHHGYQTHINFPKSETIKQILVGDQSDWSISSNSNRIFLQTYSQSAHTNMTVFTNKRVYEFDLIARSNDNSATKNSSTEIDKTSEKNDEPENVDYDLAYSINFYYPEDESISDKKQMEDSNRFTLEISDLIKGPINTNYVYSGSDEVAPIVAFNDNRFTYLKFKDVNLVPEIDTIGYKKTKVQIFSYNGYIIINDVFPRIKLSNPSDTLFSKKKVAFVVNKSFKLKR